MVNSEHAQCLQSLLVRIPCSLTSSDAMEENEFKELVFHKLQIRWCTSRTSRYVLNAKILPYIGEACRYTGIRIRAVVCTVSM